MYQANNHINQIGIIKLFQISPEKEKKNRNENRCFGHVTGLPVIIVLPLSESSQFIHPLLLVE